MNPIYLIRRKVSSRNDTTHTMLSRTLAFRFNHLFRPLGHRPSPNTFIPAAVRPFSTSLAVFNANSGSGRRDRDVDSEGKGERRQASHPTKHKPRSVSSGKPVAELTKEDEKKRSGVPEHPDESEFSISICSRQNRLKRYMVSCFIGDASASAV